MSETLLEAESLQDQINRAEVLVDALATKLEGLLNFSRHNLEVGQGGAVLLARLEESLEEAREIYAILKPEPEGEDGETEEASGETIQKEPADFPVPGGTDAGEGEALGSGSGEGEGTSSTTEGQSSGSIAESSSGSDTPADANPEGNSED